MAMPFSNTLYLEAVRRELNEVSPGLQGSVWEYTVGNSLDLTGNDPFSWILQVPDCWGKQEGNPGITRLLDKITTNIKGAKRCVDISAWGIPKLPFAPAGAYPAGDFLNAIGTGLKAAAARGQRDRHETDRLKVRVLTGVPLVTGVSPAKFLRSLKEIIGPEADLIDFNVAAMASSQPRSQNHSKLVVADGESVILGGINWMPHFYQDDGGKYVHGGYGGQAPVVDLDIALRGPAAAAAGRFLDRLWKWTWAKQEETGKPQKGSILIEPSDSEKAILGLYKDHRADESGKLDVISVGSLGSGILLKDDSSTYIPTLAIDVDEAAGGGMLGILSYNKTNDNRDFMTVNPDANAIRALVRCATDIIFFSQQDINGFNHKPMYHAKYDVRLLDELVDKMRAGVKVMIVISNPGHPDYSNIEKIEEPAKALLARAKKKVNEKAAIALLNDRMWLMTLRVSDAPTWPNGYKYRLHTKMVCVDWKAFYVGSRNAYPDTTQDHGFIIEDEAAAQQLKTRFFDEELKYSLATRYVWKWAG